MKLKISAYIILSFLFGTNMLLGQNIDIRTPASFSVNSNGSAVYQVPIKVVPGVNGMQPNLSVYYSSSSGNGPLGVGFQMSGLSEISRIQPNYIPDGKHDAIDFDGNDRFALDGVRLIRVAGNSYGGNGTVYRKEIDDFTLVTSYGTAGSGPQKFLIKYGDGRIAEFGYTTDSRVEAPGRSDVVRWRINRYRDPYGNYMDFKYFENNYSRESIIKKISYGGHLHTGGNHFATVEFAREIRPTAELIPTWSGGARQVMNNRITAVTCKYAGTQVHRYSFTYANSGVIKTSHLIQMKECGSGSDCQLPIDFSWGNMVEDGKFHIKSQFPSNGYNLDANNYKFLNGDFNGDGKMDMVHIKSSSKLSVWMSDGDGTFTIHNEWPLGSYNFSKPNNTYQIKVGDFDGDGLDDLVHFRDATSLKVFLSNGNGTFAYTPTFTFSNSGTLASNDYNYRLGDFNGDGRTDLIQFRNSTKARTLISHGDGSFGQHNSFPQYPTYDLSKNNYRYEIGDFNGDGATDLLYLRDNNQVRAFLADGDGTFTIAAPMNFSSYQVGANNYRYKTGDFNGDGLEDLVHFYNSNMVRVWLSHGTGQFTVNAAFPSSPYNVSSNNYNFQLGDFNGDGLTDMFHLVNGTVGHTWYSKGNGTFAIQPAFPNNGYNLSANNYKFRSGDFTGDGKDDLLHIVNGNYLHVWEAKKDSRNRVTKIENGAKETQIIYKALNESGVYSKGTNAVWPYMDYHGPMQVVSRTKISSGAGGWREKRYLYYYAQFHQRGRGFRGFGHIQEQDFTRGRTTITYYRYPYHHSAGKVTSRVVYNQATNKVVSATNNYLNSGITKTFPNGNKTYFAYYNRSLRRSWDLNTNANYISYSIYNTRDAYGNLLQEKIQHHIGSHQSIRNMTYNNDGNTSVWRLGRKLTESKTETTPGGTTIVQNSQYVWDPTYRHVTDIIREPQAGVNSPLYLKNQLQYDVYGNVVWDKVYGTNGTAPEWRNTRLWYGSRNRFVIQSQNPVGHVTKYTRHNHHGKVLQRTDPDGLITTFTYNGLQRLFQVQRPGQAIQTMYYTINPATSAYGYSNFQRRTIQNGKKDRFEYWDLNGNHLWNYHNKVIGGNSLYVGSRKTYDHRGFKSGESMPYKSGTPWRRTSISRDVLGRKITELFPDGSTVNYSYNGLVTTVTNKLNQTNVITRNHRGEIIKVRDNNGKETNYQYDGAGNVTKITDPQGHQIFATYDNLGRKTMTNDPDIGIYSYVYNAFGEKTRETNAKNQIRTYNHDKIGRLTQRTDPDGTTTFVYDTKKAGKLTAEISGPFRIDYNYNGHSRLDWIKYTLPGIAPQTFNFTYNGYGNLIRLKYPNGLEINHTTTIKGELQKVTNHANSGQVFWESLGYDTGANLNKFRLLDGTARTTTLFFDHNTNHLTRISTPYVQDLRYQYDALGNLKQRKNQNTGATENIVYDNLNRLREATFVGQPPMVHTYDDVGNLTHRSDVGCYEYPTGRTRKHAVTSIKDGSGNTIRTMAYDANGNMTTNGTASIIYSSFNKPTQIAVGSTKLEYDYGTDRKRKVQRHYVNGALSETRFYVSPLYELTHDHSTGTWKRKAFIKVNGKTRAIQDSDQSGGNVEWFALRYDNLGSVEYVTRDNAAGIRKLDYDVWGRNRHHTLGTYASYPASQAGNYGFTNHEHLDINHFIHMGGRLYDPTLGRTMSADPVVANPYNGQHYNRYSYAVNQPLVYTDPSGYTPESEPGFNDGYYDGGSSNGDTGAWGGGTSTASESSSSYAPTTSPAPLSRPSSIPSPSTGAPAQAPAPTSRPSQVAPSQSPAPARNPNPFHNSTNTSPITASYQVTATRPMRSDKVYSAFGIIAAAIAAEEAGRKAENKGGKLGKSRGVQAAIGAVIGFLSSLAPTAEELGIPTGFIEQTNNIATREDNSVTISRTTSVLDLDRNVLSSTTEVSELGPNHSGVTLDGIARGEFGDPVE